MICDLCGLDNGTLGSVLIESTPTLKHNKLRFADLCVDCEGIVKRDRGWQEREKARLKAEEERLAEMLVRNQTELF